MSRTLRLIVDDSQVFYKGVKTDLVGPHQGTIPYTPGTVVTADSLDMDPTVDCGHGIHICRTLAEALKWSEGGTVVEVELVKSTIVQSNGKLRTQAVKVLRIADLTRANLTRANLTRANLTRANLTGANLTGADLHGADLRRADLHGADLRRADLHYANLHRADLYRANLYGANLYRAYANSDTILPQGWIVQNGRVVKI